MCVLVCSFVYKQTGSLSRNEGNKAQPIMRHFCGTSVQNAYIHLSMHVCECFHH